MTRTRELDPLLPSIYIVLCVNLHRVCRTHDSDGLGRGVVCLLYVVIFRTRTFVVTGEYRGGQGKTFCQRSVYIR